METRDDKILHEGKKNDEIGFGFMCCDYGIVISEFNVLGTGYDKSKILQEFWKVLRLTIIRKISLLLRASSIQILSHTTS